MREVVPAASASSSQLGGLRLSSVSPFCPTSPHAWPPHMPVHLSPARPHLCSFGLAVLDDYATSGDGLSRNPASLLNNFNFAADVSEVHAHMPFGGCSSHEEVGPGGCRPLVSPKPWTGEGVYTGAFYMALFLTPAHIDTPMPAVRAAHHRTAGERRAAHDCQHRPQ